MATAIGTGAAKVAVEERPPSRTRIEGVPTAVVGFVGLAESGPVGEPVLVKSFDEYVETFGRDTPDSDMTPAARLFFLNGGRFLWAVRTVHYEDASDASSKASAKGSLTLLTGASQPSPGTVLGANQGPFAVPPGSTLVVSANGDPSQTATFSAAAASRTSGDGPFALSNGETLLVSVNGGAPQTVAFLTGEFADIGAATAAEVAAVINAKIVGAHAEVVGAGVKVSTDRKGTSASLNVTGGTANGELAYATGSTSGTGNVADSTAVTVAEVKAVVEAAVSGVVVANAGGAVRVSSVETGPSSSVQVVGSSTADDELGLDNAVHAGSSGAAQGTLRVDAMYDGSYSSLYQVKVDAATNGDASAFLMVVLKDGAVVDRRNASMDPASPYYVGKVPLAVRKRLRLEFVDLALSGTAESRRPANGTHGPLSGGDDGLVGIADADFVGAPVRPKTGMYALDAVPDLAVVAVPGRATASAHNEMLAYCEVHRAGSCFAVLDPPAGLAAQEMVEYVRDTALLEGSSEFGAIYWPRLKVANPNPSVYGSNVDPKTGVDTITVPPSGAVCGIYARTDGSRLGGVYLPPAGVDENRGVVRGALGLETDEAFDEAARDLLYPHLVNPLNGGGGLPLHLDGVRTLRATGDFPTIAERRGVIYIERSIARGLLFAKFGNNDEELQKRVARTVERFLEDQTAAGAFRSRVPSEAFYVDAGPDVNTDDVVFARQLIVLVGLATQKPAEFVLIRVSQLLDDVAAE